MHPLVARLACLLILATGLLALVTAQAVNPPGAPADHFLSYKAKASKGTTKFTRVGGVRLVNDFEDVNVNVTAAGDLLVPVRIVGDVIVDATTHLRSHKIKAVKGSPKHVKRLRIPITNYLGTLLVDTVKPDLLLVPTAVDPAVSPPPPDPGIHNVDHFTCYLVRSSKGSAKLAKGLQITVDDPFTHVAKVLTLQALKHLCVPVDQEGEGIKNQQGKLACYTVKRAKGEPKHVPQRGLRVNNQFAPLSIDTAKENELCVPAVAPIPTPTPGPNTTITPTPGPTGPHTATPTVESTAGLPPDPATVAPSVDGAVASIPALTTSFLYSGADPIQTGVAENAIDARRAAVLRGKVLDPSNAPLFGVRITVLGHPELGQTLSRADGMFDLAVNGGGILTVDYDKAGFLPLQRQTYVPWHEFVTLPHVMLTRLDSQMTTVDLSQGGMHMARGSVMSDADGTRQATLLVPAGTTATLVGPNGDETPSSQLSIRATEYTVGSNGPKAMPGDLPASSAYTYAVEFSADEAIAAGAQQVTFSGPVFHYVENFLNFPVGTPVPTGFYDRLKGVWVASANGVVIGIVSITSGRADLDTDGDGNIDDGVALGVTDAERQQLAALYTAGQSLWRVPIPHFSTVDCNWPFVPPDDATTPGSPPPQTDDPVEQCLDEEPVASVVECQNQTLGETVPVVGTPFTLNYRSDRVPGRQGSRTVNLVASGPSVPASLERIEVALQIAGQTLSQTLPPNPNQNVAFTWDGRDAYGRLLQGRQPFRATIGYVYDAVYATPAEASQAFGAFGAAPISADRTREQINIGQVLTGALGTFDARGYGLGGWTLDVHHAYDPEGQILYLGNGRRVSTGAIRSGVTTVAGGGTVTAASGILARSANLVASPFSLVFTADGALFFSIPSQHRIGRVNPDGVLSLFGSGPGFGGDGQLLGFAQFSTPLGIAVGSDGVGYVADSGNNRVRRVEPIGTISTFAGNGQNDFSGDDGLALDAELSGPNFVAVGPDGSVYIADNGNGRIRRVGTDGIIHTIAGGGATCCNQIDGIPALEAELGTIGGLAVDLSGIVYFANGDTIIRIGADGTATRVAGDFSSCGFAGDDGPAKQAELCDPTGLTMDPDGNLYVGDRGNDRVRVIGTDGIIGSAMGGGSDGSTEEAPATQALVQNAQGPAIAPDGTLHAVAAGPNRIRRLQSSLPVFEAASFSVASEDGGSVFQFDPVGRHLRTLDPLTGGVLYQFGYDGAGRLVTVFDGDGNVTQIARDSNGVPTAIAAPFGQQTTLSLDANGFLSGVENPAGEAVAMTYTPGGLLTAFTDPRGNTSQYDYDGLGLLELADAAGPGSQSLSRAEFPTGHEVSRTTVLGRTFTSEVARSASGSQLLTSTAADGTQSQTATQRDGLQTTTFTNGTSTTSLAAPDPRFGMEAPVPASYSLRLPSTLQLTTTTARTAVLTDSTDPFSLESLTNTTTVNGRTAVGTFTAATRTFVNTTPEGRTQTVTVDGLGRFVQGQFGNLDPVHVAYDGRGRVQSTSVGSGPNTRTLLFTYNAEGFLATITDPIGRTGQIGYDAAGRITSKTLPDGRVVSLGYDASGNPTSVTPPGRPAYVHGYSNRNELTLFTPPAVPGSGSTTIAYDADSAVTNISRAGVQTIAIGYDTAGRPATRTLTSGGGLPTIDTFTYDSAGRTSSVSAGSGVTLTYAYDGLLPVGMTWSGPVAGSVTRTYDSTLRLGSQSVNGANPIAFTYDDDGLLTGAGSLAIARDAENGLGTGTTLGNVATSRTFNGLGEPTSYTVSANGSPLYSTTFVRDGIGRITQNVETIASVTDTYVYTYDTAGQLSSVTKNGSEVESYDYDTNGNRASATVGGVTDGATYDNQDRLTQYGSTTFAYDAAGDLTSKTTSGQSTTYEYDPLGNLMEVSLPNGTTVSYLVDGYGRRIGRKVDGTLVQGLLYDDLLRPIAELDGAGTVVSRFVYSGGATPAYMIKAGATLRMVTDQIGSVRLVVDASTGAIAQRLDYDSFGNVLLDTNPGFQPFGFAGGLYDPVTKLVRFGLRDYDPRTGRWTAQDALGFRGNDHNLYRYCANDPVNRLDRGGLDNWDAAQGFFEQINEEIQVAVNPILGLQLLLDSAVKAGISALGFDPGPTMSDLMFRSSFTTADRSSEDYATGQLAGVCVGVVGGLATGGVARTALARTAKEAETLARQGRIAERLAARDGTKVDFGSLQAEAAELRNAGQRFVQSVEEEAVEVLKGWKTGGGGNGILSGGGW